MATTSPESRLEGESDDDYVARCLRSGLTLQPDTYFVERTVML